MNAVRAIDHWIFCEYSTSARDLSVFRGLFAGTLLLLAVPRGLWIEAVPAAFYSPPPGPAAMLAGVPSHSVIVLANLLLALSLAALLIGWHTRLASLATGTLLLFLNLWMYSFGKIDHDILIVVASFVLLGSAWGDRFSVDARQRKRRADASQSNSWPVTLLVLLIGAGMFTAGWAKLQSGWLSTDTQAAQGHFLSNYFVTGRHTYVADLLLSLNTWWLWELADYLTVLLELAFLPAILNRQAFRWACAAACVLHLVIWLLMDIPFWSNVLVYGVVVPFTSLPYAKAIRTALQRPAQLLAKMPAPALWLAVAVPPSAATLLLHESLSAGLGLHGEAVVLLAGAVIATCYFLGMLKGVLVAKQLAL